MTARIIETRKLSAAVLFFLLPLLSAGTRGEVVFSNSAPEPEYQVGGSCFAGEDRVAVGFSVPSDFHYWLERVKVYLNVNEDGDDIPFSLYLYEDSEGLPGQKLSFVGGSTGEYIGEDTFVYFSLEPTTKIMLRQNTAYWIGVENSSIVQPPCAYGWNWGDTPHTGVFQSIGEARQDAGGSWYSIGGNHVLQIEASTSPPHGRPSGIGPAYTVGGFQCDGLIVIGYPGEYVPTFENGNGLIFGSLGDGSKLTISNDRNGNIQYSCKGKIPFNEEITGIQPGLGQEAYGTIVSFEEMCETWSIVAPESCETGGAIKLNYKNLGVECLGFETSTRDWQQVVTPNGNTMLRCSFQRD